MRGSSGDFAAVYAGQRDHLLRIAVLVAGERELAEEAVADAVARTWHRWDRTDISDPGAYLRRAVINAVTDRIRGRSRDRDRVRVARAAGVPLATGVSDAVVDHRVLIEAMATLPFDHRVVLVLRYFDDQSEADTATTLGVPVGTVKSRTSRALAAMAEALRETEEVRDA